MSEISMREIYGHYDDMPTEHLQEILRKHAHGELEVAPNTEELFYIMGVLRDRAKLDPSKKYRSVEDAHKTLVEYYVPEMREEKAIPRLKNSSIAQWAKRVAVVAVVCVTLAAVAVGADAFVPGWWDRVHSWTKEIFSFEHVPNGTQGEEPEKQHNLALLSLQEALDLYNITQPLAPSWLPDGYVDVDLKSQRTPREVTISAVYEKEESQLVIKIRQIVGAKELKIEKTEGLIEVYSINGIDYFLIENNEAMQAAWVVDEFECLIGGNVSMEELKRIIDSI